MPQYDGSVVIDTALDNDGFEKGSQELEAAIKELSTAIKQMGGQLQETFGQYTQAIEQAVQSTGVMSQSMDNSKAKSEELGNSVRETKTAVDDLQNSSTNQTLNFEKPKQQVSALTKEINALHNQVDKLGPLADKAAAGDEAATRKLQAGYDNARESLTSLEDKLTEFGEQKIPTEDYVWVGQEIDKVSAKLEKLQDRKAKMDAMGTDKESKAYKSLSYDIDQAKANLQDLEITKKDMETSGSDAILGIDTEAYRQARAELDKIGSSLDDVKTRSQGAIEEPKSSGWSRVGQAIKSAAAGIGKVARLTAKGGWAGLKWITKQAAKAGKSLAQMAGRSIANGIKRVASRVGGLGSAVKGSKGSLSVGLKSLLRYGLGIRSLYALVNKLRTALVKGWQGMAGYDSKFNAVMSEFIGSLKQLGNAFSAAFAPVLNVVLPILTQLINGMSEATTRFGMMIAALTGQKSFTKATKVQYDYAEASGTASDELDKEGKAAKETKKQLMGFDQVNILSEDKDKDKDKDKNGEGGWETVPVDDEALGWADTLKQAWENADFTNFGRILGEKIRDALNSIPWDTIKNTMRKIGKSLATFLNGILETPGLFDAIGRTLAQGINSAFEFLNAFVQNFHWASLGQAIKDGILGFCNNIDWPLIYSTFSGFGAGIGTALQTGFNNPEIWTAMLTTLANGLNTLVYGLRNFLTAVDWGSLGTNIATGLNNGIAAIDWQAITQTLIAGFNGIFHLWLNAVTTFDWFGLGSSIGTCLSDAIRGIDWFSGAYALGETVTGLLEALIGFVESVDWGMIGEEIVSAIGGFFAGLDWAAAGTFISDTVLGLLDALIGAIEAVDWGATCEYIFKAIGDFLTSIDWTETAEKLGRALGDACAALCKIGSYLWDKLLSLGDGTVEGLWEGIKKAISDVGKWIQENIFDPFINAFKDAFGIHSPAKEMEPLGGFIIDGLLNGITGAWDSITHFFGTCGQKIWDAIQGCLDWFKNAGEWIVSGIQNGIAGAWDGLCNAVGGWCGDLWDGVVDFFQIGSPSKLMRDTVGKWIPLGIAEGIDKTAGDAVKTVGAMARAIADEADSKPVLMPVSTVFDDGTSGLDAVLTTFADKVANTFSNLLNALDRLVSGSDFMIPAMAMGTVAPYATSAGRSGSTAQDLADALSRSDDTISKSELTNLLIELGRKIEGISFYIGDTDLARHVNKGNNLLDRKYKV